MELRTLRYFLADAEATGSQTLAKLIKKFTEKYPSVQFTLYNETVDNIKDRLNKGLVDIGLLLEPIDVTKYDYVRLSQQDTWGLLVRDDHPLNDKQSLSAEDVAPYPLILPLRDNIRAEIMHWHGAKKDSWFSHIAVEVPGEETSNEWLGPVEDEAYNRLG